MQIGARTSNDSQHCTRAHRQVFPDTVKVTHTRKETSISSALETQQFMFEYRILLVFDRLAQRLHATSLRISGLEFGAKASPDFRLAMGQVNSHTCIAKNID